MLTGGGAARGAHTLRRCTHTPLVAGHQPTAHARTAQITLQLVAKDAGVATGDISWTSKGLFDARKLLSSAATSSPRFESIELEGTVAAADVPQAVLDELAGAALGSGGGAARGGWAAASARRPAAESPCPSLAAHVRTIATLPQTLSAGTAARCPISNSLHPDVRYELRLRPAAAA